MSPSHVFVGDKDDGSSRIDVGLGTLRLRSIIKEKGPIIWATFCSK